MHQSSYQSSYASKLSLKSLVHLISFFKISVNLMLVNGGITPFKSLLTSYNSPAAGLKSSSSTHLCRVASLKKQSNTLHHTYDINRWKGSGTKLASEAPALAIEGIFYNIIFI